MNVARPIKTEEYKKFREELYEFQNGAESKPRFAVSLDSDPTMKPKAISEKLAEIQAYKDRALVIYNRAILCEAYWRTVMRRIEAKHKGETKRAALLEEVRKGKSADIRVAEAERIANEAVVKELFKDKKDENGDVIEYDAHFSKVASHLADAGAFMVEMKHIYENLDETSKNIMVQLKSVMVNVKVYGDPKETDPVDKSVRVS
jgi:hypothetical protein